MGYPEGTCQKCPIWTKKYEVPRKSSHSQNPESQGIHLRQPVTTFGLENLVLQPDILLFISIADLFAMLLWTTSWTFFSVHCGHLVRFRPAVFAQEGVCDVLHYTAPATRQSPHSQEWSLDPKWDCALNCPCAHLCTGN